MDSIKSFKGYGKVSVEEERAFRSKTRRRYAIICASVVILVVIAVGAVVGTRVARGGGDGGDDSALPASTPSVASSIKAVCNVTLYPDACFSSLSSMDSSNKWDPEELFRLAMRAAAAELRRISGLPDRLAAGVENVTVREALEDCKGLFDEAAEQVNMSVSAMAPGAGEKLSKAAVDDLRTWLSSAVTDQQTCLDGLQEVSGELFAEMQAAIKNSTELTSNSLAIGSRIITILQKFDISIHRKLLAAADFPDWLAGKDRRLLQQDSPAPDVVVAKDGSGNFTTVAEAVAAVPNKSDKRFVIHIKKGNYLENVVLDKSKWNVMLVGDGMDATIISGKLNFIDGTPTFRTATVIVIGRGFMARDIGFYNTAGPEKHQAVALRSGSDRSVFYRCRFDAYQDTLYAHSNRQFYRDCTITGTIDFIFGNAAVVFQKCLIQPRQPGPSQANTITAQGKVDPNQPSGISIQASQIQPLGTVTAKTYLGRPWKAYSTTVVMKTAIGALVDPAGWLPWGVEDPPATIFYGEYQNTGAGAGVGSRVKWAGYNPTITDAQASKFTVVSLIQGQEWIQDTGVTYDSTL